MTDETVAVEPTAEEREAQAKAEATAAHMAHPHTQLHAILKTLQTPGHDINDRVGTLHGAVSRLTQVILAHTPAPETHDDEGQHSSERRQPVEGSDKPQPGNAGQ